MALPQVQQTPYLNLDAPMNQKIYYNIAGNEEYICIAEPGTGTDEEGWQIRKLTYTTIDGSPRISAITWADGNAKFDKIADDAATYDYTE